MKTTMYQRFALVAVFALVATTAVAGGYLPPDAAFALAMPMVLGELAEGATLADIAKEINIQGTAFHEFKTTNDARIEALKKGLPTGDFEAKLAKIEKALEGSEDISKKLVAQEAEFKAAKAKSEETEKALGILEGKMAKFAMTRKFEPAEQLKAWNTWAKSTVAAITQGAVNLSDEQRKALDEVAQEWKALSVQNDSTGGYLAPVEMGTEIIKGVTEISPVRALVRVRSTTMKSYHTPKRTGQFAAVWVAEQGTRAETDGLRYGMLEIPTHEIYALIDISEQNLEDSAYDMAGEITEESREQFAVAEGAAVVGGSGVGKPEGWLTNADVLTSNSGAAATVTGDGLITLKYGIKTAYARNASFALNRTTLAAVRKLKDANGQYLWMPGLAQGRPNSIDGDPYVEVPDMPSPGAGNKIITYGDFARAYVLIDRVQMVMLRDPFTQATSGNVRFIFRRRQGGKVVLPEAIKTMVCSV